MKRADRFIGIYRIFFLLSFLTFGFLVATLKRPSWGAPGQIDPSQQGIHHTQRLPDSNPDQKTPETEPSARQKQNLLKSNFEKTKDDAAELADMAKGLRDELNKTNVNVFSLDVVHRAEKIEKLARRIKEEAKGY